MLRNQIKIALRNLRSAGLFTTLNVAGLTGGMVAAVFILLWVQNELSFDNFHAKSERISRIVTHLKVSKEETWHWSNTPLLLAEETKVIPEIEAVSRVNAASNLPVRIGDRKIIGENAVYVDTNWFSLFDYQFVDGSAAQFRSAIRNVAITEAKAQQLFGRPNVAGTIIRIDTLDYTIAAVYKNNPPNSSFQYDYILPLGAYLANPKTYEGDKSWNQFNYQTFILLRHDADRKKVAAKLTALISKFKKDDKGNPSSDIVLEAEPLANMHFNTEIQGSDKSKGDRKTIYIFFGMALVILLVACINYVNITTARASVRSKEVGVKKLLGAKHSHLFAQFMTESVLTCLMAFGLALVLIYSLMPVFNDVTEKSFALSFSNKPLWFVLLGTTVSAILLTGIYPSLLLSSFRPFEILRGSNVLGSSNAGFRKGLVVLQFTVTVVFLISALVVFQQMKFIREKELGYDRAHAFGLRLPWAMKNKIQPATFKEQLLRESSIADVTISSQSIVQINSSTTGSYDWDGRPKDFNPVVSQMAVESNFQSMFGLKIAEGRWFDDKRLTDKQNVVLNETAVKKLMLKKPVVGKRFNFQGKKGVVIGVVKDFHYKSLREKIEPLVLFNDLSWSFGIYVKAQPGRDAEAIRATQKVWEEMIPNYPLEYNFLDETYDKLYKNEAKTATLFNTFTTIAVLISSLGLFGLATFTAERRMKEIGIRKVLGASVTAIVSLLSKDFLILVLISIVVASPVGYYFMDKWLRGFEYKIDLKWWLFAMAGSTAIVIALVTISFQSIKAALTNPVKSLKTE
ncbi:ABC transporter permease [Dyadobacter chenwenxiniae]|uniref:ABC transporter permease n=1 Tax=Dyadobacter chenwenxiniae TaxID=2906456 RepID=A0A9X1PJC3_9BACT|nr:ABC transporter permease [Dyadobacter chenwenxiniae]MCF0061049.1 ABC transporter permease [Dyadobacter chenwenxiniae]UON80877.1 ABC transporter permease [Dyadobacter chenwenxiniae]